MNLRIRERIYLIEGSEVAVSRVIHVNIKRKVNEYYIYDAE